MNLKALKLLYPNASLSAVEINPEASKILAKFVGDQNVYPRLYILTILYPKNLTCL